MINLPHASDSSTEVGAETRSREQPARSRRPDGRSRGPAIRASADEAQRREDEPHDARVAGVDEAVEAPSALHREPGQPVQARIDVEDPVERNDDGGRDRLGKLDEVAVPVRDAAAVAASGSTASAPSSGTCADQDPHPPHNSRPRRRVCGVWLRRIAAARLPRALHAAPTAPCPVE